MPGVDHNGIHFDRHGGRRRHGGPGHAFVGAAMKPVEPAEVNQAGRVGIEGHSPISRELVELGVGLPGGAAIAAAGQAGRSRGEDHVRLLRIGPDVESGDFAVGVWNEAVSHGGPGDAAIGALRDAVPVGRGVKDVAGGGIHRYGKNRCGGLSQSDPGDARIGGAEQAAVGYSIDRVRIPRIGTEGRDRVKAGTVQVLPLAAGDIDAEQPGTAGMRLDGRFHRKINANWCSRRRKYFPSNRFRCPQSTAPATRQSAESTGRWPIGRGERRLRRKKPGSCGASWLHSTSPESPASRA